MCGVAFQCILHVSAYSPSEQTEKNAYKNMKNTENETKVRRNYPKKENINK